MSTKQLSPNEVKHIAQLINVPLSDAEVDKFGPQLTEAVDYVAVLQELDLNNTPETAQVTGLKNVFREDVVKACLTQEEALKNAKQTHNGYFVVPAVIMKRDYEEQ